MVEECELEIELTLTDTYHNWTSEITRDLYNGREFETLKDLKKAISDFYKKYRNKPDVYFNSDKISYNCKFDRNNKKKFFILESGIGFENYQNWLGGINIFPK